MIPLLYLVLLFRAQGVVFTATVSSIVGTPMGMVTFMEGASNLGPRDSPRGTRNRSPRALSTPASRRSMASLSRCQWTRQPRRLLEKGVAKETKTGNQTVVVRQDVPAGRKQGRKLLEKGVAKETMKDTPAAPPSRLALLKRS